MFEEMTTLEVWGHRTLTRPTARKIVQEHGLSFADFENENGNRDTYTGKQVFEWLGY